VVATVRQPHPPWSGGSLATWHQPAQRPREIAGLDAPSQPPPSAVTISSTSSEATAPLSTSPGIKALPRSTTALALLDEKKPASVLRRFEGDAVRLGSSALPAIYSTGVGSPATPKQSSARWSRMNRQMLRPSAPVNLGR
jgi:hypothetical protein